MTDVDFNSSSFDDEFDIEIDSDQANIPDGTYVATTEAIEARLSPKQDDPSVVSKGINCTFKLVTDPNDEEVGHLNGSYQNKYIWLGDSTGRQGGVQNVRMWNKLVEACTGVSPEGKTKLSEYGLVKRKDRNGNEVGGLTDLENRTVHIQLAKNRKNENIEVVSISPYSARDEDEEDPFDS